MRPCSALALCLTAALATATPVAAASPAADGDGPLARPAAECLTAWGGEAGERAERGDFPVTAAIERGPDTYHPGDAARNWTVALTNTTDAACDDIHPILVLVDEERTLRARQPKLEFREGDRWRPVPFTRTDRDENIGVFDDGFPGFTIAPGETVDVPVRLAFAPDTEPHRVVAHAALIQRRDDDGDWVGQSDAYEFAVTPREDAARAEREGAPDAARGEAPDSGGGRDAHDAHDSLPGAAHPPAQLAETGVGGPPLGLGLGLGLGAGGLWTAVAALLVGGGALAVWARRRARG
ncbi:hypothetical protein ACX6XY_20405 [Streptomyces sp. O3]